MVSFCTSLNLSPYQRLVTFRECRNVWLVVKSNLYREKSTSQDVDVENQIPLLDNDDDDSEDELYERSKNPQKPDAISKVKNEIEGVMSTMRTNLGKVLDRGDKLEDLESKSESFEMHAFKFKKSSTKLQNRLWWQNCKTKLLLGGVVVAILIIIIVSAVVKSKK